MTYKFRHGAYLDAPQSLAMAKAGDTAALHDVRLEPSGVNVRDVTGRIDLTATVVSRDETEHTYINHLNREKTDRIARLELEITDIRSAELRALGDDFFAPATAEQMAELRASLIGQRRHYVATHVDDLA